MHICIMYSHILVGLAVLCRHMLCSAVLHCVSLLGGIAKHAEETANAHVHAIPQQLVVDAGRNKQRIPSWIKGGAQQPQNCNLNLKTTDRYLSDLPVIRSQVHLDCMMADLSTIDAHL